MTIECQLILLEEIAEFLNRFFAVEHFSQAEKGGVYLPSSRPVKRLGLALEPQTQLQEWASAQNLDALFLHRPWKLQLGLLPPDIGVISYHLPFDECLTIGFNPRLAQVLNVSNLEVLGEKENRAIGMLGEIPDQSFESLCSCVSQVFGGTEQVRTTVRGEVKRVAVVGAMTDLLVREAANCGVDVYITGQLRQPAEEAIRETQIGAIAVGHRRSEVWGLRALAGVLQERWLRLEVVVSHFD
ncbi:Nif3-like dinuclear metal center hexameric protein [Chlorogloeopsis sp. ULAP01]|uniref:Nif3-like dinuclear metal center hexameric protein n=1 Tax=Chlorogloeopsis sp. ULAP01 TaxID=3056483 RepID=UPI0025AB1ED4|nr:Nif3-like dinuclear metal center hexameric protein [Chlorogloeopsis sp. ULAP01]MDM9383074.1 Nif3-like dinuclear metal center hexameric protein [Chlorogloeopsis sp. ULAP01]